VQCRARHSWRGGLQDAGSIAETVSDHHGLNQDHATALTDHSGWVRYVFPLLQQWQPAAGSTCSNTLRQGVWGFSRCDFNGRSEVGKLFDSVQCSAAPTSCGAVDGNVSNGRMGGPCLLLAAIASPRAGATAA
jgi:hypothetical protein